MTDRKLDLDKRTDRTFWIDVDPENPLSTHRGKVEVTPERQRWMAAPAFSRNRFQAVPVQKKIGLIKAMIIIVRNSMRQRDDTVERLRDIEELILAGHNDAADRQMDQLCADYPTEEMKGRVLGLASLNWYDRHDPGKAQYFHECALVYGSAHPVMIEIFGDNIRGPGGD